MLSEQYPRRAWTADLKNTYPTPEALEAVDPLEHSSPAFFKSPDPDRRTSVYFDKRPVRSSQWDRVVASRPTSPSPIISPMGSEHGGEGAEEKDQDVLMQSQSQELL